jgi:hypothetical protein
MLVDLKHPLFKWAGSDDGDQSKSRHRLRMRRLVCMLVTLAYVIQNRDLRHTLKLDPFVRKKSSFYDVHNIITEQNKLSNSACFYDTKISHKPDHVDGLEFIHITKTLALLLKHHLQKLG